VRSSFVKSAKRRLVVIVLRDELRICCHSLEFGIGFILFLIWVASKGVPRVFWDPRA
jgi:hypothetical protein